MIKAKITPFIYDEKRYIQIEGNYLHFIENTKNLDLDDQVIYQADYCDKTKTLSNIKKIKPLRMTKEEIQVAIDEMDYMFGDIFEN